MMAKGIESDHRFPLFSIGQQVVLSQSFLRDRFRYALPVLMQEGSNGIIYFKGSHFEKEIITGRR